MLASYTDGINTEAVLGDRVSCEAAVQEIRIDTTKRDSDGFVLESGSGDITKVFYRMVVIGYSNSLPSLLHLNLEQEQNF